MPPVLHYPDLASPPVGWTVTRTGSQIRLHPPAAAAAPTNATIIVSPLVARHKGLPPIEQLIALALEAEEKVSFQLMDRTGPTPITATTGLVGCYYEVRGFMRPSSPVEQRIYVMYSDNLCYYGINYVADEATYDKYLKLFWDVARSIKPFAGRVVSQPPPGTSEPGAKHDDPYKD